MTPELFDASVANTDNSAGVILVEVLRGLAENGLLANLHKDRWLRHVSEKRATTLSPALKDKVLACLSVLHSRHRLVRHPKCMAGDPGTDQDWLNLAFESHDRISFHAIILSQALMDGCGRECNAFVEFFGSLDSAQWNGRRKRTLSLTKSDANYRSALAPILRHAKALALIDPWLNSQESRYFDTIAICSNVLGQRGHARLQGRIDIHAEAGKQKPYGQSVADYLTAWEQKLRPLITADNHRFRVFLWESLPGSESMHDRFILTDQCGISTPGGLDCRTHSHANSTDWSLLDEDVRLRRWNEYDPAVSPFNLLGNIEIS
jgi:hypothetical protein